MTGFLKNLLQRGKGSVSQSTSRAELVKPNVYISLEEARVLVGEKDELAPDIRANPTVNKSACADDDEISKVRTVLERYRECSAAMRVLVKEEGGLFFKEGRKRVALEEKGKLPVDAGEPLVTRKGEWTGVNSTYLDKDYVRSVMESLADLMQGNKIQIQGTSTIDFTDSARLLTATCSTENSR